MGLAFRYATVSLFLFAIAVLEFAKSIGDFIAKKTYKVLDKKHKTKRKLRVLAC